MSPNIKLVDWIPQNDLLGHPNLRIFVTHGGANSQFEAVYHAVPMLVFPVYGDQPSNAARVAYKGLGLHRSFVNVTPESLIQDINHLMNDKKIQQNLQLAAKIFKDQPMKPKDRAVYWVEHVIKYGGEHLRAYGQDMPWYQYLMLDVMAIFVAVSVLVFAILLMIVKDVWRLLWDKEKTD